MLYKLYLNIENSDRPPNSFYKTTGHLCAKPENVECTHKHALLNHLHL